MTTWPDAIQYLTKLQRLDIRGFSYVIPVDAFKLFRTALTEIYLYCFNFTNVPLAVCGLHNLERLDVETSRQLICKNLLSCHPALNSLSGLILQYNYKMTTFPDVLRTYPNIQMMRITGSGISFVDDGLVPNNTKVSIFHLSYSNLTTIPGAVNKFPFLHDCHLYGNKIRSIERHSIEDLPFLHFLHYLNLESNPIIFISKDAFRNVPRSGVLGLSFTQLTTVPLLVETIPSLTTINLNACAIRCTCEMPHPAAQLTIEGLCHGTHEAISTFVSNTLPQCP